MNNLPAIEFEPNTNDIRVSGVRVHLRPLERRLLRLLVDEPGRVFSRDELLEQVWGLQGDLNTRRVDIVVFQLRAALGAARGVIETAHGDGYRGALDVRVTP